MPPIRAPRGAEGAPPLRDILVIGGGVNGCGIARDAAGRRLSVELAERGDLACGTSSASTKLFHGGLRYLEYFELRLVREALRERETLLAAMPHISWPMRFVLPHDPALRLEAETPASRLVARLMPWTRGRRPAWMIRAGLFAYDHLGGRRRLPGTRVLDLRRDPAGAPLQERFARAFEYSDCWVDDARLVALNARDAAARGAVIATRSAVTAARAEGGVWTVTISDAETGATREVRARVLVNAAGPWVAEVLEGIGAPPPRAALRLVRGSHIVTRRLFEHDRSYVLQGPDGRIVFTIPYERDFTLIGTTEAPHDDPDAPPVCTAAEEAYLLDFVARYFRNPVTAQDIVWRFSGVRPLYDDGAASATAATRDYVLALETGAGAPLLNVFGGKITTYRKLAEQALGRIGAVLPGTGGDWTAGAPLPGGDFPVEGVAEQLAALRRGYPFLDAVGAERLLRAYGADAAGMLGEAARPEDLGPDFGAGLTAREVAWLMEHEFARTAEDVLWRRSKLGLRFDAAQTARLEEWMAARRSV
ncbi:glycerol-3-phosphate dehydrogenase [Maritimibacter sp. 55A14]|uniref:glycerol-3-phosphate dehydrogenase n=1 Tax=Maritimibacter sp. 55A14 TaxID=2174844 RepID=UPI000D608CBF|nr:glycerol-3-phosphate dehydrogenase [Maritimibacter sp. 55A14]PWE34015.1 glycerol-3-phosphate dehydrogenase [Maritimibacter sp. 55A14]